MAVETSSKLMVVSPLEVAAPTDKKKQEKKSNFLNSKKYIKTAPTKDVITIQHTTILKKGNCPEDLIHK